MRIALYIEPHKSSHANFYTKVLFKKEIESRGHVLDIYIPDDKINIKKGGKEPYISTVKELSIFYGIPIIEGIPKPSKYGMLFVFEDYYKYWSGKVGDYRKYISDLFNKSGKHVLCLKDDTIMEVRPINSNNIIYGIPSNKLMTERDYLNMNRRYHYWILPSNVKHFIMPVISNLSMPKPTVLSKEDFYQKYGLDSNLKIIAYLPGKVRKWRSKFYKEQIDNYTNNFKTTLLQTNWFLDNFDVINNILRDLGYQLVGKLHIRDSNKFIKGDTNKYTKTKYIKYVDQYHSHELLKYADYAITFATTMVYQLYLYDLPTLDLGTGIYYPRWAFTNPENRVITPLQNFRYGRALIYGEVVNFTEFQRDPKKYLNTFFTKKFNIETFKYRYNNPIYGNSYGKGIKDIVDILMQVISRI